MQLLGICLVCLCPRSGSSGSHAVTFPNTPRRDTWCVLLAEAQAPPLFAPPICKVSYRCTSNEQLPSEKNIVTVIFSTADPTLPSLVQPRHCFFFRMARNIVAPTGGTEMREVQVTKSHCLPTEQKNRERHTNRTHPALTPYHRPTHEEQLIQKRYITC